MGDVEAPTELVSRLQALRQRRGLTIQQMAEKSGLPKSSLESYMKSSGAKRPGVDALVAIADGLGTSIDWIVGRTPDDPAVSFSKQDYAFLCHSVVLHLLNRLLTAAAHAPETALQPVESKVLGHEPHEIAALAMLDFVASVDRQAAHHLFTGGYFNRHFDSLERMAREGTGATSIDGFFDRKPETN